MRKIVLLFVGVLMFTSCADNKKKDENNQPAAVQEVADEYSITFEGIYEKDDVLLFAFKQNGYFDYEHQSRFEIKGSPIVQKFTYNVPKGIAMQNVQIDLSSNKEQKVLTLNEVSISKNGKIIMNGANREYSKYFNTGVGLSWDEKQLRFNLHFDREYPPRITGNDQFESIIIK